MHTEQLKVTGMTCGGCTSKVAQALKAVNGVSDVKVSLSAGEAEVRFDEQLTSSAQLTSAIEQAGNGVGAANPGHEHQGKSGCCG